MFGRYHHWLPVILAVYLPISFVITYSIAVASGHVEPWYPYISDTGTFSPESCVFGQLLNIGAVFCGIIIYIRYLHVDNVFGNRPRMRSLHRLNMASFIIGLLTVLGVSMVGNFQETNVIVVHLLGAFLAFGIGFVYFLLQTIMSFKMKNEMPGNTICIRRSRVVLCITDVFLLIILFVTTATAGSKGPGEGVAVYNWTSADPGYAEHLVATVSEWLIALVDVSFFVTFYKEFKEFRVDPPKIVFYNSEETKDSLPSIHQNTDTQSLPT